MITKIRLHMFIGTTVILFGWYFTVDSLPRSRWIPDYVASVMAIAGPAARAGDVTAVPIEQPRFFTDNPVVTVLPAEDGGYVIRFTEASKRRCDQLITNSFVKANAAKVTVGHDACRDANEVQLLMRP